MTATIAMNLGGSFHMTSIHRTMSIMKLGILPGGTEQLRSSSFFNYYAPWDRRSESILRSRRPPHEVIPVVLYVPIAILRKPGARLSETSYTIMFDPVPWDYVKGAWYKDPKDEIWKRLLVRGISDHLILAVRFPTTLATKHLILEKAKEVVASGKEKDENIRKLKNLKSADPNVTVSSMEEKERVQVTWNEIISRTCESFMPADGNIHVQRV